MMKGVTIQDHDNQNYLEVDLKDILKLLGIRVRLSLWRISEVEALGEKAADVMHHHSDTDQKIDGQTLLELAEGVWQIIDGTFEAFMGQTDTPWLIIRAVDSSAFDVESNDDSVLEAIRSNFRSVTDLPTE